MSLEGLSSLIQLESTRLEGAKQTNQNSQSVNNAVQQQGTQVAQSRLNSTLGRINAQYDKEVAMADVRKLERRLVRERASEQLSLQVAALAGISNAIGNFGHLVNDLKGRQKLGETPDYLKAPPITSQPQLSFTQPSEGLGGTAYISGANKDGTETIYSYQTGKDGVSVGELPLSANISEYDKERILGADYAAMKASNGGQPLSFSQIHAKRPDLADKLITTKGHGVSSTEAEDLMRVAKVAIPSGSASTIQSGSRSQAKGSEDGTRLAAVSAITNDSSIPSGSQIAAIAQISSKLTGDQKQLFFKDRNISQADITKKLEDPDSRRELFANEAFKQAIETPNPFPNGEVYLVTKNQDGTEDVQYNDNGIAFEVNNLSAEDKAALPEKYKNMSFSEILAQKPDGASFARQVIAGRLSRDFNSLSADKKAPFVDSLTIEQRCDINYSSLSPDKKASLERDYGGLFKNGNGTPDFSKVTTEQEEKLKKSHPELFVTPTIINTNIISTLLMKDSAKANELVTQASGASGSSIKPLDASQATQSASRAGALNNLHTSTLSLKDNLVQSGKLSDDTTLDKAGNVAKHITNFLVTTMEQTVPYFQAYLKAKERADRTYEELVAAMDKLNAAANKLKAMELQIDTFGGRGA